MNIFNFKLNKVLDLIKKSISIGLAILMKFSMFFLLKQLFIYFSFKPLFDINCFIFVLYSSYYLYPKEMTSNIFIFILLISTVSQLGDIIISYFKRLSKIKDTGKIIPGHGGLLDRLDGMIFAFPFCYGIFSYFY